MYLFILTLRFYWGSYPILEFILISSIVVYISNPTSRPLVGLLVDPRPFKLNPLNISWKLNLSQRTFCLA